MYGEVQNLYTRPEKAWIYNVSALLALFSIYFLDTGMVAMLVGSFDCRVTEESLLDRMSTNMHESCLKIDKDCR